MLNYERKKLLKLRKIEPFKQVSVLHQVREWSGSAETDTQKLDMAKPFVLKKCAAVAEAKQDPACRLIESMQKWRIVLPKAPDTLTTGRAFALCEEKQGGADAADFFKELHSRNLQCALPRFKAATTACRFYGQVETYLGCEWTFEFLASTTVQWEGASTWHLISAADAVAVLEKNKKKGPAPSHTTTQVTESDVKCLLENLDSSTAPWLAQVVHAAQIRENDALYVPAGWLCLSMSGTLDAKGCLQQKAESVTGLQAAHLPLLARDSLTQNFSALRKLRPSDEWVSQLLDVASTSGPSVGS